MGLEGQYYLKFYPHWDDLNDAIGLLWDYILVSETELIIPDARSRMYRMEKVEEYPVMEDEADCLEIIPYQSIMLWIMGSYRGDRGIICTHIHRI